MKLLIPLLLVSACSELNKEAGLKDDNPIESAIEFVIKEQTGAKIDLTPENELSPKSL